MDWAASWHSGAEGAGLALGGQRRGLSIAGSCLQAPTDMMRLVLLGSGCHKTWGSSYGLWVVWVKSHSSGTRPWHGNDLHPRLPSTGFLLLAAGHHSLAPGISYWDENCSSGERCRGMRSGEGTSALYHVRAECNKAFPSERGAGIWKAPMTARGERNQPCSKWLVRFH